MSQYNNKKRLKIALMLFGLSIGIGVLVFTNVLLQKIEKEERKKVALWAKAIQERANMVAYTNSLFSNLRNEEGKRMELWSEAYAQLYRQSIEEDITLVLSVIESNTTIPVILTDANGRIIDSRNLDSATAGEPGLIKNQLTEMALQHKPLELYIPFIDEVQYLYYKDSRIFDALRFFLDEMLRSFIGEVVSNTVSVPVIITNDQFDTVLTYGNLDSVQMEDKAYQLEMIASMRAANEPIVVDLGEFEKRYIVYQDSPLQNQLQIFPFFLIAVIGLFIALAYWIFSMSRKSEQDRVWVGMAKETAHQLGTPISSLLAWTDNLKEGLEGKELEYIAHMQEDLSRLETITDRFSKIGGNPDLKIEDIITVTQNQVEYLKSRSSKKVIFNMNFPKKRVEVMMSKPLYEWVIENLLKNAINAMGGQGEINVTISEKDSKVIVDVQDNGKGIPKADIKNVFEPGFTTRKRGWGLGLSLSKRIIEEYHEGEIFILKSEVGKGTTFRVAFA